MSNITSKIENGILTLLVSGRIDSSNAAETSERIDEILGSTPHTSVVLDIDYLEYLSSAGLRVLLRLRKNEPTLTVVNASSEVYEIFEMTGFIEMIPISKAYRRISVEGCEVIGQGANGKVYRIDPDTIVKVYLNPDALPDIKRERELARRAFVLGIPTAIPYDVVRVGEGYGSVFELLNAKSFSKLIADDPEKVDEYVDLFIDLLKKIHATEVKSGDMPDMREIALDWAKFVSDYLTPEQGNKLVSMIENVPVDHHMMHGDYHIKNVMMQNGEVLLIDMDTICQGHPVFELASMFNAFDGFLETDHLIAERFLGIPYETSIRIWKRSLALYLGTEDEKRIREVEQKAQLVGYTRLMRRSIRRGALDTEEGRNTIDLYRGHIVELLDRINTLEF